MAMTPERRRQIDAMNQKVKYRQRVAAGRCTRCGVPADRVRCPDCLNKHNAYRRERRKEQKEMASNLPPGVTNGDIEDQQGVTPVIIVNEGQSETDDGITVVNQACLVRLIVNSGAHHGEEFHIIRPGYAELDIEVPGLVFRVPADEQSQSAQLAAERRGYFIGYDHGRRGQPLDPPKGVPAQEGDFTATDHQIQDAVAVAASSGEGLTHCFYHGDNGIAVRISGQHWKAYPIRECDHLPGYYVANELLASGELAAA